MSSASGATVSVGAWTVCVVVKLQPVSSPHLVCVIVDPCDAELRLEELNGHEERAVIELLVASLVFEGLSPLVAVIAPWTLVSLDTPWVSDLDESDSVTELNGLDERVSVTADKSGATGTEASHGDHGCFEVLFDKYIPELCGSNPGVLDHHTWGSSDCVESLLWVSTHEGLVAAMELGESLLIERTPDRFVSSDVGVEGSVSSLLHRESIIDSDSHWHHQCIHVDGVNAIVADAFLRLVLLVSEELGDAAWLFSQGTGCGKEPAITNLSLTDIMKRWLAARAPEGETITRLVLVANSLPFDTSLMLGESRAAGVRLVVPSDSVLNREGHVLIEGSSFLNIFKWIRACLDSILRMGAGVADGLVLSLVFLAIIWHGSIVCTF